MYIYIYLYCHVYGFPQQRVYLRVTVKGPRDNSLNPGIITPMSAMPRCYGDKSSPAEQRYVTVAITGMYTCIVLLCVGDEEWCGCGLPLVFCLSCVGDRGWCRCGLPLGVFLSCVGDKGWCGCGLPLVSVCHVWEIEDGVGVACR